MHLKGGERGNKVFYKFAMGGCSLIAAPMARNCCGGNGFSAAIFFSLRARRARLSASTAGKSAKWLEGVVRMWIMYGLIEFAGRKFSFCM